MDTAIATRSQAEIIEQVVVGGDLGKLSPSQRVAYYAKVCESTGLNPYTKPFEYIRLNGRLTLYARKDATDQLRRIHGVSLDRPTVDYEDDMVIVTITGRSGERSDTEIGAVSLAGLKGDAKANAIMKAHTKAKRRLTLSLCGLGWLDETEIETIPSAQRVEVDERGQILNGKPRTPFTGNGWEPFFLAACDYYGLTRQEAIAFMGNEADYQGLSAADKSALAKERISAGIMEVAGEEEPEAQEEPEAEEGESEGLPF